MRAANSPTLNSQCDVKRRFPVAGTNTANRLSLRFVAATAISMPSAASAAATRSGECRAPVLHIRVLRCLAIVWQSPRDDMLLQTSRLSNSFATRVGVEIERCQVPSQACEAQCRILGWFV